MPKRKERAAGYIRESDPSLADSATIDSAAKAVREHCQKEGYDYTPDHEYKEALSAYMIPYTQRPRLLELLAAAKRGEFTVLVVTEIRALSRKQVEVFVLYDMLQRHGVRLETIQEKFEDSAIGRFILATRAMDAEIERENTFARTARGRKDRIEAGNLPGHGKPAYGHLYIDTARETNARFIRSNRVVYADECGKQWTESDVIYYMAQSLLQGRSLRYICITLTEMGVPTARVAGTYWRPATVYKILTDERLIGKAYTNKWVKKETKNNKFTMAQRPKEEWIALPDGLIEPIFVTQDGSPDIELFDKVQKQLEINRQDSWRNNRHNPEDVGLLRAGFCRCGICKKSMTVRFHNSPGKKRPPEYKCQTKTGKDGVLGKHFTGIGLNILDAFAWEKAVETILDPNKVRERVELWRRANAHVDNTEDIEATIEKIKKEMQNLFKLARSATDDDAIESLTGMMHDLERQKREAEKLLNKQDEEAELHAVIETEIQKFEKWAEKVRSDLTDPDYTPTYEEKRLAVRILGITAIVYPEAGDWPFRKKVEARPPEIVKYCVKTSQ